MSRLRVGVNTLFLIPGEVGGSETYLRDILHHAIPRQPDIEWILFTNLENHESFETRYAGSGNVRLVPMGFAASSRANRILREQLVLPVAARRAGVDVLWSPGYTAPFQAPCPQVVTVFDMQYREYPQDLAAIALQATRFLVPMAVRAATRVITISEFSRDQVLKYVGVDGDRVIPILLAADQSFSKPLPGEEAAARRTALIPAEPYILCVANTYPHKNIHALVEAFGRLGPEAGFNLVLVGSERRGEREVKEAYDKLPDSCKGRVIRLRRLQRPELIALYQGAAVFAFPSLYEGFGLPVLESMAAGVPVVTTSRGPMREIGGDTIHYFDGSAADLARSLAELVQLAAPARDEIIGRARVRAAQFSWERTADQTVAVLRDAVRSCG